MNAKLISFLVLLYLSLPAAATSFDCKRSSTQTEKRICEEPALSALDDKLNRAYQSALQSSTQPEDIRYKQKVWLRQVRNKCITTSCLVEAYETRIRQLSSVQSTTSKNLADCPLTEAKLRGAWERVSDAGFFEEMAFDYADGERTFDSWLHHRPEIAGGAWRLENCVLFIRHPTEDKLNFAFTVVRVQGDRIYLREEGDKSDAVYKRIKP